MDKTKFKNVILYFTSRAGDAGLQGKVKLAKLLYFADFDFFELYERPLTGAIYRALRMGPCPEKLDAVLDEMIKGDKTLAVDRVEGGYTNPLVIFRASALIKPEKIFKKEELEMLGFVYHKYSQFNGRELHDISSQEAPFNAVVQGEVMPYELSFYRGKDFAGLPSATK